MNFAESKTAQNLMKSFAGESQARNRYTYYASVARKEGFLQIEKIFIETANQEKEHAKRFYKFLKEEMNGQEVMIEASYPVFLGTTTAQNLQAAANGENEEWSHLYPEFARVAKEEGYGEVAKAFENIAKVEAFHEERYLSLLKRLNENKLYAGEEEVVWICTNCGYNHKGKSAPALCPACLHEQKYFEII